MAVHIPGLIAVIVFYLLILAIGIWAARKTGFKTKNLKISEVMTANRSLSLLVGAFTTTATWVGGGYINGSTEITAFDGLVWCQAPVGFGISLSLAGLFFADKMRTSGFYTMLDPFCWKYGDLMGCLLYLPALTGDVFWTAAILAALGATLKVILDIGLEVAIIVSAAISVLYTILGGLYSVAYTDVIQLICIFVGLWLVVPFALTNDAVTSLSKDGGTGWLGELDYAYFGQYMDFAILLVFGGIPWQVYWQRALSAQTSSIAVGLSFIASIGCVVMAIPAVVLGGVAKSTNWTMVGYESESLSSEDRSLTLPLVMKDLCPTWVSFVGLGAVSAAVMSSTDSSILSSSSMFAKNVFTVVYARIWNTLPSETMVVWVMRAAQLVIAALACIMAVTVKSVYDLFVLCADLVFVILYPQLLCVMYLKDTNTYGSFIGYIIGLLFRLLGGEDTIGLPAVIKYRWYDESSNTQLFPFRTLAMLLSLFSIIFVSYLIKFLFDYKIIGAKYDIAGCFTHLSETENTAFKNFDENYENNRTTKHDKTRTHNEANDNNIMYNEANDNNETNLRNRKEKVEYDNNGSVESTNL